MNWIIGEVSLVGDRILELPGLEIDEITELSLGYGLAGNLATQLELIEEWNDFIRVNQNASEKTSQTAFEYSMFAGRFHEGSVTRPLENIDVEQWRSDIKEMVAQLRTKGAMAGLKMSQTLNSQTTASLHGKLFVTSNGFVGVCPDRCRVGDKVFILCLCKAPIFLRPISSNINYDTSKYVALGHGYVHGLMNGEASELPPYC